MQELKTEVARGTATITREVARGTDHLETDVKPVHMAEASSWRHSFFDNN